jgi:hypothetical protein
LTATLARHGAAKRHRAARCSGCCKIKPKGQPNQVSSVFFLLDWPFIDVYWRASGVLASARGLPGRRARCSLGFRIGAVAPRSNFLAHFSCVIVVSAAQRAASKTEAAGCAVGRSGTTNRALLAKSSHGWLAIRFAHERGPLRIAGTSQRTRCSVVLTAFAGALPDLVGQPCAEQMGDAAQPRRRRRAAPRRTLSEQRKKPRTAAPAPKPSCRSGSAALFCSNLHSPAA